MMKKVTEAGWKQVNKAKDNVNEEEIKALFDMIDKDKSGSLSMREAKRAAKLIKNRFGIEEVRNFNKQKFC